ncbi:hypothetical protein ACT3TB_16295 [Micrococcaceae sp. AOP34-BR2-30]
MKVGTQMILREKLYKARASDVHAFLPQELLSFALPARRTIAASWTRQNGELSYTVTAGAPKMADGKPVAELPSGKYARAALVFLCTQAKLTGEPVVTITESYRSFIQDVGLDWHGAQRSKEVIRQLMLISTATFSVSGNYLDPATGELNTRDDGARFSDSVDLWTAESQSKISGRMPSTVTLSPMMMAMMDRAAPLSMKSWTWLLRNSKSPMALDVYAWLCGRLHRCEKHGRVSWQQLYNQFGSTAPLPRFKQHFRAALDTAMLVYPEAQIKEELGISRTKGFKGFHLFPSPDPRDSQTPDER